MANVLTGYMKTQDTKIYLIQTTFFFCDDVDQTQKWSISIAVAWTKKKKFKFKYFKNQKESLAR